MKDCLYGRLRLVVYIDSVEDAGNKIIIMLVRVS